MFWPYKLMNMLVYDCSCQTAHHKRSVSVVDVKGTFCTVEVQFCSCSSEFVQLLQFGLWGATPTKPRIAFAIEFFELVHSVQMECQASIKSICQSFEEFNHNHIFSYATPKMYPVIIDAFEEYRIYRHKLNMLSCVIPELDEGNICPACPKTDGVIFESLDALFIGRRKKAGQSIGKPLFEQLMFYDQTHVDQFVANYTTPTSNKECHGFCAGNAVRSMNRYRALDETAIFGRGCRHEFPKKFLNLKHGELVCYFECFVQVLKLFAYMWLHYLRKYSTYFID
ncbi:uncharacterized protein LOC124435787 [Xenia sp. Carnegie-2017]|uniref:uncharacterized protein LOC124435787 n=1 Tax=Xenia sp. Carnegie-2017 TaxID=2897299 RepID=UPI001F04D6E7|nr:uncharacterized protein LOC124435787 [Xenia sp. Carnegie-2017]